MPAINTLQTTPVGRHSKQTLALALVTQEDSGAAAIDGKCEYLAVYVEFSAGTTSGVVKVETANDVNYAGTWAILDTLTWAAASSQQVKNYTGTFGAIRVRVSTVIAGGSLPFINSTLVVS